MENEIEKFSITKDEEKALLFMYYNCLYGLKHFKGLRYKQCFEVKKSIDKIKLDTVKKNINDFIEVIHNVN